MLLVVLSSGHTQVAADKHAYLIRVHTLIENILAVACPKLKGPPVARANDARSIAAEVFNRPRLESSTLVRAVSVDGIVYSASHEQSQLPLANLDAHAGSSFSQRLRCHPRKQLEPIRYRGR